LLYQHVDQPEEKALILKYCKISIHLLVLKYLSTQEVTNYWGCDLSSSPVVGDFLGGWILSTCWSEETVLGLFLLINMLIKQAM